MSTSNLTRWSGMAAVLGATLLIIAALVRLLLTLFFFDPTEQPSEVAITTFYIGSLLALSGTSLLLLGVVGLYVRQSEATGTVGSISFLATFFGLALTLASIPWSDLLETFGWALFGVVTLQAGVYPRPAAILLVIGAVATGLVGALSGGFGDVIGAYVGVSAAIILNVAIAWLGFSLFTRRGISTAEQPQH